MLRFVALHILCSGLLLLWCRIMPAARHEYGWLVTFYLLQIFHGLLSLATFAGLCVYLRTTPQTDRKPGLVFAAGTTPMVGVGLLSFL